MPKLDIDMFDKAPRVGDKVKVMGKVDSINEESGEVEVTYDDVTIVKKTKKSRNDDSDDSDNNDTRDMVMETEMNPNSQSLDSALGRTFGYTQ